MSPGRTIPGCTTRAFIPRSRSCRPETGVDEAHCLGAEPLDEFRTAQMRGVADLQHGLADREQAARWEIAHAEIKVDVELVAGQRHPVRPARDQLGHPGVHHRHLPPWVSRPIRHARAAAGEPIVPGKPCHRVEQRLARQLPHTDRWAADHQYDPATIPGRITNPAKSRFQALTRQMLHDPILTGPLPSWPTHIPRGRARWPVSQAHRTRSFHGASRRFYHSWCRLVCSSGVSLRLPPGRQ